MLGSIKFESAGITRTLSLSDEGHWLIVPPLGQAAEAELIDMLDMITQHGSGVTAPFGPLEIERALLVVAVSGYRVIAWSVTPVRHGPPDMVY